MLSIVRNPYSKRFFVCKLALTTNCEWTGWEPVVGVRNSELRAAKAFLDQFYADHPWETFSCAPKVASELHESPAFISQIDAKLHRLIKTLFIAPPEVKRNSYFAIRKLACIHPSMVVRHLKTLGSVLKARHSKNVTQLVASGEVLLFTFTIEILNVLRPLAFDVRTYFYLISIYIHPFCGLCVCC
jgi:hypothetical protein